MATANEAQKLVSSNAADTLNFIYESLNGEGKIRLLKLLPTQHSNDRLQCELVQANLSENPLYAAVSYTWDTSGPLIKIRVNGKELPVRKNVADLLGLLQTKDYVRTLWIDSICINQASREERNAQVRLMGDVFAGASYVISWLGHDGWSETRDPLEALLYDTDKADRGYGLQVDSSKWFLQHRYWTRRWIVQEILLARSVILLSARGYQLPLVRYSESLKVLLRAGSFVGTVEFRHRARKSPFARLFAPGLQSECKHSTTLAEALYTYRETKCSETNDRVYALASLSEKAQQHLKVNYGIDRHLLLMSVVDFCTYHEALPSEHLISLLSLLKQQLSATDEEFQEALTARADSSGLRFGSGTLKVITMHRRGTVDISTPFSSQFEEHVLHCRSKVPPLAKICQELRSRDPGLRGNSIFKTDPLEFGPVSESKDRISGHDLFAFEFRDKAGRRRLGLSSSWLKGGDEVLHSCRTPVALCVRAESSIVGRAYILRGSATKDYDFRGILPILTLEEIVDFNDEEIDRDELEEMLLSISVPTVMNLLKWVNFDDQLRKGPDSKLSKS